MGELGWLQAALTPPGPAEQLAERHRIDSFWIVLQELITTAPEGRLGSLRETASPAPAEKLAERNRSDAAGATQLAAAMPRVSL